jgi:hypothetical protein
VPQDGTQIMSFVIKLVNLVLHGMMDGGGCISFDASLEWLRGIGALDRIHIPQSHSTRRQQTSP